MTAIGQHKFILAGGPEPIHGHEKVFGHRRRTIQNRDRTQVLINYLGSQQWINVEPTDVSIYVDKADFE